MVDVEDGEITFSDLRRLRPMTIPDPNAMIKLEKELSEYEGVNDVQLNVK